MTQSKVVSGGGRRHLKGLHVERRDLKSCLLKAADGILSEDGFHSLTQVRISKAAGLRQSHLTYYFPTCADLRRAVLDSTVKGLIKEFTISPASAPVALADIRNLLVERMASPKTGRRLRGLLVAADENPDLESFIGAWETYVNSFLTQCLKARRLETSARSMKLLISLLIGISVRNVNRSFDDLTDVKAQVGQAFDGFIASGVRGSPVKRQCRAMKRRLIGGSDCR
jgi:DNA-binding transcriptional regulator YbjK